MNKNKTQGMGWGYYTKGLHVVKPIPNNQTNNKRKETKTKK